MSLSNDAVNLAELPSDIIRVIIPMVPEAAECVRLISPFWNTYSLQYLATPYARQRLPTIKLCWSVDASVNHILLITCLDKYRYYFGVAGFEECQRFEDVVTLKFQSEDKKKTLTERIFRLLNTQCSNVDLVDLSMDISLGKEEIYKITQAMGDVPVNSLRFREIRDFDSNADFIMDLIRATRVHRILFDTIDIYTIRRDRLRDFFSHAVQHVSAIEFLYPSTVGCDQRYTLFTAWNTVHFWLNEIPRVEAIMMCRLRITVKAINA